LATDVALRTVCEALTRAACLMLELEPGELQAEYRPALTAAGRDGLEAEIYLYDTLPGGAGFASRVGELGLAVFAEALRLLRSCPDSCDRSCYRCIRSYKNKFEHDLLDRHIGAGLLKFLIDGTLPTLDVGRLERSTDLLFEDLRRHALTEVTIERNVAVDVPGFGVTEAPIYVEANGERRYVVAVSAPLMPTEPPSEALRDLREYSTAVTVELIDEIRIRRNLPAATRQLLDRIR